MAIRLPKRAGQIPHQGNLAGLQPMGGKKVDMSRASLRATPEMLRGSAVRNGFANGSLRRSRQGRKR